MSTELSTHTESTELSLGSKSAFDHIQRVANLFAASQLVPDTFRGNLPNCVVALEMANRMGASPFAVIQNLNIIHGRPSFSSQYLIAALNSCGRFLPLRFHLEGAGDERTCIAWTIEVAVAKIYGDKLGRVITLPAARAQSEVPFLEGVPVSIAMAKAEGWATKNGSKWKTMPELMLRYRAAAFFVRFYAPEITMGIRPTEEVIDIEAETVPAAVAPVVVDTSAPTPAPEPEGKAAPRRRTGVAKAAAPVVDAEVVPEVPAAAAPATATVRNTPTEAIASTPAADEPSAAVPPVAEVAPATPAAVDTKQEPPPPPAQPAANVIKARVEFTKVVKRDSKDPKKSGYCECETTGEYAGTSFYVGPIADLPDPGTVADVTFEKRESKANPGNFAHFITAVEIVG